MIKKIFVVLLTSLIMISMFIACAPSSVSLTQAPSSVSPTQSEKQPQQSKTLTFGVIMFDFSNVFTSYIRKGLATYVKDKNVVLEVVDAAGDMTKQTEQAQTFIKKGVDALIIAPVDSGGCGTIVDMAKAANIPVIFFDKKPLVEDLERYEKAYYVGLETYTSGILQNDLIVKEWKTHPEWDRNGDGTMQYLMLMGSMGDEDAEMRTQANREGFVKHGVKVEELDAQVADWDTTKAKDVMDTWVVKYGNTMEVIICNNDAMALGVVESLKSAGYLNGEKDKYIPIFGVNAIPDILDMIVDGTVAGTVLSDPWSEARAIADIAINLANGKGPFEGNKWSIAQDTSILIPNLPISKAENLDLAKETYRNCL